MSMNEVCATKYLINLNVHLYLIQKVLWLSNVKEILGSFISLIFIASNANLHETKHKHVDMGSMNMTKIGVQLSTKITNVHMENCNVQEVPISFWKEDRMKCCLLALDDLHLGDHPLLGPSGL